MSLIFTAGIVVLILMYFGYIKDKDKDGIPDVIEHNVEELKKEIKKKIAKKKK
jgi:hypothetical protein